jgi:hypothetical protein
MEATSRTSAFRHKTLVGIIFISRTIIDRINITQPAQHKYCRKQRTVNFKLMFMLRLMAYGKGIGAGV